MVDSNWATCDVFINSFFLRDEHLADVSLAQLRRLSNDQVSSANADMQGTGTASDYIVKWSIVTSTCL